ncbi:MAG TPA: pyridoxal phosphate-dependent aminotransferase [Longimicrobiales bacterium]
MSEHPPSWAPYMTWAKHHPQARFDLQGSNLLACPVEELPGAREVLALSGPNDEGHPPLLEAIARRYGTVSGRVASAPGASGANFLALAALARPGDTVLVEWPGYDPHAGAARLLGLEVRTFSRCFEDGFALDPGRVQAALTATTRAVVVSNPHNPSGVLAAPDALAEVGRVAEAAGARVIVDEVYLDGVFDRVVPPAGTLGDVFITTNSLTKSYGLSGLRAGWVIAAPDVIERVRRVRDVVDAVGAYPSDVLATLAFQHLDRLRERARSILLPNMASLAALVEARPELSWVPPAGGNVAFPRLVGSHDAGPFVDMARERFGVGVVPGSHFGAPEHFRVAVAGEPATLVAGLEALGAALDAARRESC